MARFLKNAQLVSRSHAIQVPLGSSSIGPDSPVSGQIRFNQTNSEIEFYYNTKWYQVAHIGSVQLVVDSLTSPDGVTQTFTMSQAESDPTAIIVTVGGVYQIPNTHYSVNGSSTITFLSAPPMPTGSSPNQIVIIHNINSTNAA
jgi:hypothetical protein